MGFSLLDGDMTIINKSEIPPNKNSVTIKIGDS
jgi:hypothetical protein